MGRVWDPARHPRDSKGRFTRSRTTLLTDAEAAKVHGTAATFHRKLFRSAQAQADYLASGPERPQEQRDAIRAYTGGQAAALNEALRTKSDPPPEQRDLADQLRAAMQPTTDDLVLTRTVPLSAFGDTPIDQLAGKKVKDAGFTSASLGLAADGRRDNVVMQVSVPKGTPALFVGNDATNPGEREVILPDGMEFAVASATKNDRGGYDMHIVALPQAAKPAAEPTVAPRKMSDADLEKAMNDALTAEDFDRFDELATETDRRDQAKAAALDRKVAAREAREQAQAEEFDRLLSGGWDEESAVAKAYGVSVEKQRSQRAIALLRDGGYRGKSFNELSAAAFRDHIYQQWLDAEDATNGYMLNRKAKARGVDPKTLFAGPERVARANASDELLQWWDQNGRPTLEEYRAELLGDNGAAGNIRAGRGDFLA